MAQCLHVGGNLWLVVQHQEQPLLLRTARGRWTKAAAPGAAGPCACAGIHVPVYYYILITHASTLLHIDYTCQYIVIYRIHMTVRYCILNTYASILLHVEYTCQYIVIF